MSEQIEDLVENLKRPSLWRRVFFTLGFALLFNIILVPLVLLMVLVQVAFAVFAGEKNSNLSELSEKLVAYIVEVLGFLLFTTERRPFPFNDFPGSGISDAGSNDGKEAERTETAERSETAGRTETAEQAETAEHISQLDESKDPDGGLDEDSPVPPRGPSATPQG
jgi:hypothetical protein